MMLIVGANTGHYSETRVLYCPGSPFQLLNLHTIKVCLKSFISGPGQYLTHRVRGLWDCRVQTKNVCNASDDDH